MIATKLEFMAPTDIAAPELEMKEGVVAKVVTAAPLVGTWLNVDKQTAGLVRIIIAAAGTEITVHAFGACSPTPCDWGTVPGVAYATNVSATPAIAFSAQYKFSFKQTIVVGHLNGADLTVETFDNFTDGSGRSAYYSTYVMQK